MKWLLQWTGALLPLAFAGGLWAGPYVSPSDIAAPFRRDQLPLDADAMTDLAGKLLTLAKAQGGETPADRRSVAQLVAVALALKPGDAAIRDFNQSFGSGQQDVSAEANAVEDARKTAWSLFDWFQKSKDGGEAKILAACLGDVLTQADPRHPNAAEWRKQGEQGRWEGWVCSLAVFTPAEPVASTETDDEPPEEADKPLPDDTPLIPDPVLKKAGVQTVVWTTRFLQPTQLAPARDRDNKPVPADRSPIHIAQPTLVTLKVDVEIAELKKEGHEHSKPGPWTSTWHNPSAKDNEPDAPRFAELCKSIRSTVESAGGTIPKGWNLAFSMNSANDTYRVDKDPAGISGALALLLHCAASGRDPEATVIGEIRPDGSLVPPKDFWKRLRVLENTPSSRVIVPASAAPQLANLLALERPEFFLKHEVLLAGNLTELADRAVTTPPGDLAEISAKFKEIEQKRGSQRVASYLGNRFIRQRLEDISRAAPYHASARLLIVQASGQRPAMLTTDITASELTDITATTDWIARPHRQPNEFVPAELTALADACKARMDALKPYVPMQDRSLLDQAEDLVSGLRSFARALRKTTDSNGRTLDHVRDLEEFRTLHMRVTNQLKARAGLVP